MFSFIASITLLITGLTITLSLSFLVIALWQDIRKELNQFFAIFLMFVTLWNTGALLLQALALVDANLAVVRLAITLVELGFTGSGVAIYILTAVLVGAHTRRFRWLAFASLLLVVGYQCVLVLTNAPVYFHRLDAGLFTYQLQPLSSIFYLIFDSATFYLAWRYRRKIRSVGLTAGIMVFVTGQAFGLFNPELRALSVSINISSIAALVISFAILRREIITPLAERVVQIEAMHRVSLAITSQLALDTVLDQIASQAVGWLDADASGIFLKKGESLILATVYNLPRQFIDLSVAVGEGVAGVVASLHRSIYLESYSRDWHGIDELPLARETFGSVICVPLVYGGEAIGVLMVIAGVQGRLFSHDDVHLLELLGSQAAVAIAHSRLFADQRALTEQVEAAHSQLETVLTGTENPVIAVDRQFRVVFANPAAATAFDRNLVVGELITSILPPQALPASLRDTLSNLRRNRTHIYEISLNGRIYLCHIARLGRPRITGFVAVLNDVTQLKELDRIKSEMVRMTSHDLKNPIQAALANVDLLRDDLAGVNDHEISHALDVIEKQLERMHRIISGILDLERIKSGATLTDICRPAEIVDNTLSEMRHWADDKQIKLVSVVATDIPNFQGDVEQFSRALTNLVENGIKFTPIGGQVTIKVIARDNRVIFEVSDSGIGIPLELHERIFERFFRGRQKGVEHVSGSGLGLSLVKTIVENHGGEIFLESTEGVGTTFYIVVPALHIAA
jgi:signal transduction histidine kinase